MSNESTKTNQITEGVIWKQLLIFFFPIVVGTLFQQLYNTVDAVIVGRFVGKGALAAVGGSSAVLSNLIIGCFTGLASGASVIVSQFYGAKDERNLQKSLHTAYAFSVILSIVFTILGWALTPFLLKLIDTPADTLADSILYLRIYFLGIFGTLIFNIGSAIMRSIGDSRRPLYYLIVCCFLNIILDLVLVIVFDMGIVGAAIATIISQAVSAIDVRSLEGVAPTKKPCVPIIAVPTTAGTAAEVTINYVVTDVEKKRKFVCVDPHDMPIIAVVDPEMMSSMPKGLTASTGMDALTHAIEGYTTKAAWEMTDMFHLKAIEIISKSLRGAVENTKEGREGMALGQYIAGMGFSNVGLGIAHSMAHTLGAVYDTPHGVACAMMLPIVMEYNADCTGEKYREIAREMGVEGIDNMSQEEYRKAAVDAVRKLSEDVGIPSKLEALKEEDLQFLAESAHADACAPGNPKDASVEDLKDLFRKLM